MTAIAALAPWIPVLIAAAFVANAYLHEVRAQRDKWQQQAERLAIAPPPVNVTVAQPKSWWPWRKSA